MRKMIVHLIVFVAISTLFPISGMAQTGYVSDMLLLTFRQGPGNNYKVLKALKSNTPVNVLEEENGFLKVELQSKEIGWVDKKYIIYELPKAVIAQQLEKKNQALQTELENLKSGKQTLGSKLSSMEKEYAQKIEDLNISLKKVNNENTSLTQSLAQSRQKYSTLINQSKNIQEIVEENKDYQEKNTTLTRELETLQAKHKNSFRSAMIKWFLAGVGVLLMGWVIGSSVSSKKRKSGYLLD